MPRTAQTARARANGLKPDRPVGQTPTRRAEIRGYLRGSKRAAQYLDIDRKTFRKWRDDAELAHREFLQARIINGDPYYRIANLDRFMDPANNAPGAVIVDHFPSDKN